MSGVTAAVGPDLARVTVSTPKRRIDVALPGNALVADLLPQLLALAGDELADEGERHGGWSLRRATGSELDPARNLGAAGIRDGEVLHLVPRRMDWPEVAYDDIVEVIASGSRRIGHSWGAAATRRCGLAVAAVTFALGIVDVALSGPPWAAAAGIAFAAAAILVVLGVVLSRALSDANAGGVTASCALPYAWVGGALAVAPHDASLLRLGAPSVLLGSAALIVVSVIGLTAVAATVRIFVAGVAAGVAGLLGAVLSLAGVSAVGAVAVAMTVAIAALPGYPALSVWLGRVPVPVLPSRPEEILADRPMPRRDDVFSAVARASDLLTGALLGTALIGVACAGVLVVSGGVVASVLAVTAAIAFLLRGRLFAAPHQRVPLLVAGATILGLLLITRTVRAEATHTRLLLLLAALIVAGLVLAAGLVYSKRAPSPRIGRFADIIDVLAIMALVPLACGVAGVFHSIADLFSSVGS